MYNARKPAYLIASKALVSRSCMVRHLPSTVALLPVISDLDASFYAFVPRSSSFAIGGVSLSGVRSRNSAGIGRTNITKSCDCCSRTQRLLLTPTGIRDTTSPGVRLRNDAVTTGAQAACGEAADFPISFVSNRHCTHFALSCHNSGSYTPQRSTSRAKSHHGARKPVRL